jgi:peptide/nickel transport system substrate-binding protein
MKRFIALLLSILLVLTLFSGCTSAKKSTDSETTTTTTTKIDSTSAEKDFTKTSTLNLLWAQGIGTDGMFMSPWTDWQSLYPDVLYDTLIKYDLGGKSFVNRLASDWSVSKDSLTYTFTIRDNATWHDGKPVTAEDVVFSFNTMFKDMKSAFKQYYTSIEGSKEVIDGVANSVSGITSDGNVVNLKLSKPDSQLTHHLCRMVILPKHLLQHVDPLKVNTDEKFWSKPVGCGPYKIDKVSFPNYFTVVPYDGYYGKQPAIKNITFTSYATGGTEAITAAVIAGELDYINWTEVNDIAMAKNVIAKNPDMAYDLIPSTYLRGFYFNMVGSTDGKHNDDMQKKEVRQAINLLLDKEALASFYEGQATAMTTHVSPLSPEYNVDIPLFKRDVGKAKEMLKAANFDFNRPLRIIYYYTDQKTTDFMELLKQNLAEGGVKAECNLITGDLRKIIYELKNWDMCYGAGLSSTFFENFSMFNTGQLVDEYMGNIEYREATFRPLWNGYLAAKTQDEMKNYIDKLQVTANDFCGHIPVYSLNKVVLYNKAKFYFDPKWNMDREYALGFGDWGFDKWKLLR